MTSLLSRLSLKTAARAARRELDCWRHRGDQVECPVCGYRAAQFADGNWHVRATCPRCRAETRHRLLIAALKLLPQCSFQKIISHKRVLHFAPERAIRRFIRQFAAQYTTADFARRDVDLWLDIACMPAVADGSMDCCMACDVLEHVPDDRAALSELYRVLAPGGTAIITVPQSDNAARTFEDEAIRSPEERLRAFGQADHVRLYGADVIDRMTDAGFEVQAVNAASFDPADVARFVLHPPVLNPHPLATNFRSVFFCRKR